MAVADSLCRNNDPNPHRSDSEPKPHMTIRFIDENSTQLATAHVFLDHCRDYKHHRLFLEMIVPGGSDSGYIRLDGVNKIVGLCIKEM